MLYLWVEVERDALQHLDRHSHGHELLVQLHPVAARHAADVRYIAAELIEERRVVRLLGVG